MKYLYDYDSLGRPSKEEVQNISDSSYIGSAEYGYDVRNNLTSLLTTYGGDTRYQYYYYSEHSLAPNSAKYAKDNLPTYYQLYYNSRYAIYDYDDLNRLTQRKFTLNAPLYYNYTYKSSDRNTSTTSIYTTSQIQDEYIGDDVYTYSYGTRGNLTGITKGERATAGSSTTSIKADSQTAYRSYKYDDLGQLTRENNKTNNTTTLWTYDELGNITAKTEYAYTTGTPSTATKTVTYGYGNDGKTGWNNLLTSVDIDGDGVEENETIAYDSIGNPLTYLGANLTWNGRQLTSYTTDDKVITYTYDSNGIRASKIQKDYTVAEDGTKTLTKTTKTKYYYVNGQLHFQDTLATDSAGKQTVTKLYFYYDSNSYLTGIKYNGTNYYVATNKRGDVVALYYYDGRIMGRYEYDAWGNVIKIEDIYYDSNGNQVTADLTNNTTSRDILVVNPIRYRSYYYDTETQLYYLQSRYYNAEIGRFLNADGYLTTGQGVLSYNMFAYCQNNPVMYSDPSGMTCGLCLCTGIYPCPACKPAMPGFSNIDLLFGFSPKSPAPSTSSYTSNSLESSIDDVSYISDFTATATEIDVAVFNSKYPLNTGISGLVSSSQEVSTLISVIAVGYEVINGAYCSYYNGASGGKIAWDVTVDVTVSSTNIYFGSMIGGQIGAAVGTAIPIPCLGTIVGASAGVLCGALAGYALDDLTKPGREYLKGFVS